MRRFGLRVGMALCVVVAVQLILPAKAFVPFFQWFGLSGSITQSQTVNRSPVYAMWEFVVPGSEPIDGGSEEMKEAPKFPRVRGGKAYFYFGALTSEGFDVKEGRCTHDQREKRKDRTKMRYFVGKGWGFEVCLDQLPGAGERGMYRAWANLRVNDAEVVNARLLGVRVDRKRFDVWGEGMVTFGVYDVPRGRLTPRILADLQMAKGAGGMSFLPPRSETLFAPRPGRVSRTPPERAEEDEERVPRDDVPRHVSPRRQLSGEMRDVVVRLRDLSGGRYSEQWLRIEAEGVDPQWVRIEDGESTLEIPREIVEIEIFAVKGEGDANRQHRLPGPFDLTDSRPIVVTRSGGPRE